MNKNQTSFFTTVLFGIFLTLKLCNVIAWSWWWVTAPIWMPLTIVCMACGIFCAIIERVKR